GLAMTLDHTSVIERHGEPFIQRIFTEHEQLYCKSKHSPAQFYAARFAAKEAISKAFATGIGAQLGWLDIEVRHTPSGAPEIQLSGKGAELAAQRGVCEILVSLTHTESMAAAQVFLQG
ncbi:MAG: holo-ACP synthase, partial [Verrucomicrobiota bacterium]